MATQALRLGEAGGGWSQIRQKRKKRGPLPINSFYEYKSIQRFGLLLGQD